MNQNKQLTIMEFSRLTGIKRETLRFYDRIGLLTPNTRGENNYRYYSRHQLNTAYLISNLRGVGVGISDIKKYAAERTAEKTLALFSQQEVRIQAEIRKLQETSLIMQMHADMILEALKHKENTLFLEERKCESIFLCPPLPADMDEDESGIISYDYAEAHNINLGFPLGILVAQKRIALGDATLVDQYYFKVGTGGNAYKPTGLHAVAYGRCSPWNISDLYLQLLEFIKAQDLCICGDAYEEYPFDDNASQESEEFCVRIEIPVAKR